MSAEVSVRPATPAEVLRWDDLVETFSNHRIFHKQAWLRSLQASEGLSPLYLVFEKDKQLAACLPGFLFRKLGFRVFGSTFPGWLTDTMGPVFEPERISTREMFAAVIPFLEEMYHVHHIEITSCSLDVDEMQALGFRGTALPTYRARLTPGDEAKTFHRLTKTARRSVKRGLELGLTVDLEPGEDFVDDIYEQNKDAFIHGGAAIPYSKQRVLECFRHGKAAGSLLCAAVLLPDKRTRIATGMFLMEGRELNLWMWAHKFEYRWYSATELMTWTAMQKAMQAGCVTFDLSGRGTFKEKFGAELDTNVWRWVWSRYRWLMSARDLAEKSYRWQQSVRGRLARLAKRAPPRSPVTVQEPV
jgi:hypothetical protein